MSRRGALMKHGLAATFLALAAAALAFPGGAEAAPKPLRWTFSKRTQHDPVTGRRVQGEDYQRTPINNGRSESTGFRRSSGGSHGLRR